MSTTTWVALLRGINLGRHKRVAMADLRALLESLGYGDVRTHLQSGNAIFTTTRGTARELERQIAEQIDTQLRLDVVVVVRSVAEFAAVVDENPLPSERAGPKELHATFLSAAPPSRKIASLDAADYAPDEFEVGDRVIYLRLPNGVMGSRLPDWEKLLGVSATQRSWNTVTRLRDLADAIEADS